MLKSQFLHLVCSILGLSISALAGGERGAADLTTFYYAYLAEEAPDTPLYRIAKGCADAEGGSGNRIDRHGNQRCSLDKFLRFLLATPDNPAPDIRDVLPRGRAFQDVPVNTVFQQLLPMEVLKKTGQTEKIYIRNIPIPGDKLVEGTTSWYAGLAELGQAFPPAQTKVKQLEDEVKNLGDPNVYTKEQEQKRKEIDRTLKPMKKVVEKGKMAAVFAHDLRRKDFDEHFREWFAADEEFQDIRLETKPGRRILGDPQAEWSQNDFQATYENEANQEKMDNLKMKLLEKWNEYRASSVPIIKEHVAAMDSHIQCVEGAGCTQE